MDVLMKYWCWALCIMSYIHLLKCSTVHNMRKFKRISKKIQKSKFWNIFEPKILENDLYDLV